MSQMKVTKTAHRFLDSIPAKDCVRIVQFFLVSGKSTAKGSKEMKNYPFQYRDFGKYRVIFDTVDDVPRILFVGERD